MRVFVVKRILHKGKAPDRLRSRLRQADIWAIDGNQRSARTD
jgi:hypothetical protein